MLPIPAFPYVVDGILGTLVVLSAGVVLGWATGLASGLWACAHRRRRDEKTTKER